MKHAIKFAAVFVVLGCAALLGCSGAPPVSNPPVTTAGPVAEARLKSLGIELPPAPKPIAAYVNAVRAGNLLFVSGQLPMCDGKILSEGRVGAEATEDIGRVAMRQAGLNALAVIRAELGSLDRVRRVVRLVGFVASAPDFGNQPGVTNAASELFLLVFGPERGAHARLALGAAALPKNATVELEVIVEVEP